MRDSIVFYRSFLEAINELPEAEQLSAIKAILEYGLDGSEEATGTAKAILLMAKPQIDANNKRYENGKKGGRPAKKETEIKPDVKQAKTAQKPNGNQTETKYEPNENVNVNVKVNDKNNKLTRMEIDHVFETVWSAYPEKKGKGRVSATDKKKLAEIGVEKVLQAIERYKAEVSEQEWRHWQNGSTFFHSGYIDYLDENYVKSVQRKSRPPTSGFVNEVKHDDYDMRDLEIRLLNG